MTKALSFHSLASDEERNQGTNQEWKSRRFTTQIEKLVNEHLESEVLVRSSKEAKTSYAVAANLSELELKKILIDNMEANKSISGPRDGAEDDQEPSAGINRGSKRRRSGKDPESTSAPREKTTTTARKTTTDFFEAPAHHSFETVSMIEQPEEETTTTNSLLISENRTLGKEANIILCICATRESASWTVYSKRRIIAVTKVEIVEWQNYKHLDWITVRRDDDVLYKFKEGDFHRLRIQDIEDMLLLLVQGKVTNLNVEERIAFNVSLRMFTRSVVIQRRVEDLQLGVESYQKKLNLTKPDTYRSNLRRRDAYTPYSDPRGFIYENKDKKNRLMRIDELHKFSDGTLDDVRTALNDRLKGIRMEYLPQTFWSQRDKANARAMIQAIEKRLKTRRIMRSLERFVGGRPYGGDLRLLQRTI
ncbi:hypothetical protein Tco_0983996 [Tanacetum coccineum]